MFFPVKPERKLPDIQQSKVDLLTEPAISPCLKDRIFPKTIGDSWKATMLCVSGGSSMHPFEFFSISRGLQGLV